ncbi:MAG TPA: tetratricopeptide repeat protein [Chlorobaculum sp.]|nr:tetratricopeptide repeat protein [Chlorobaculum sp.]
MPEKIEHMHNSGSVSRQSIENAELLFRQALELHQKGLFAQAQAIYTEILKITPENSDVLHLLGVTAYQTRNQRLAVDLIDRAIAIYPHNAAFYSNRGLALQDLKQFDKASDSYEKAIALKPDYVEAWYNHGNVQQELKRFDEAIASYEKAISIRPDYERAWFNRGIALQELNRFAEAVASYERTISLKPDIAEAWSARGNALQDLQRSAEAVASYERAILLKPDFAEAWSNRGNALKALKRLAEAVSSYEKAIGFNPDYAEAWSNRGVVLHDLKQSTAALASYDRAISLKPEYAEAWYNRGNLLLDLRKSAEAIASYERAISLKPEYAEAWSNRGNAMREMQRFPEAIASYEQAISINAEHAEAWSNRGLALHDMKRLAEAVASYDKAISLKPGYAEAYLNKSLSLLLGGECGIGWELYEWRWKMDGILSPDRNFTRPLWLGDDSVRGKTILLHSEQGLGDTIQFCRYIELVAGLGARVVVEVERQLIGLLRQFDGVAEFVAKGDSLPPFDLHCPLLSLPLAFRTTLETIPHASKYLSGDAAGVDGWERKLGAKTKPRIGLTWSGNQQNTKLAGRRVPLEMLIDRLPAGFQYVSLQKELWDADKPTLESATNIEHYGDAMRDFTDTAALCELMDLVISIDTAAAHLSAAMGKPTWVLLKYCPDWRWLLDRSDSPWYGSARLYRQETVGDWEGVLARVSADLSNRLW